jgi:lipoprotein-releasing system permease protein
MGRIVTLVAPFADQTPAGDPFPKTGRFKIAGVFASGDFMFNKSGVFMSLKDAQDFLDLGKTRNAQGREIRNVSGLMIKVADPDAAETAARRIEKALARVKDKVPGTIYQAWDWQSLAPGLFAALKLERLLMFVLMAVGVLVGSINIISTLIMVVMEKTKDIAIMRTMGATRGHIMKIFVYQGLTIGLLGTGLGLAGGLISCWLLKNYEFIRMPEIYGMNKVPVLVSPMAVIIIALLSVALSLLATIYPAWKASRLDPAEAVRYE